MAETGRGAETIVKERGPGADQRQRRPRSSGRSSWTGGQPRDSTKLPGWQRSLVWVAGRPGNEGDQGSSQRLAGQPDHGAPGWRR